jgi:hypothetical protein
MHRKNAFSKGQGSCWELSNERTTINGLGMLLSIERQLVLVFVLPGTF